MMQNMGYGEEYQYAHDDKDAFVPGESYLPVELHNERYYFPVDRGLESKIAEKLNYLRQLNEASDFKRYENGEGA